ncbi:hypothetical protein quinque_000814 [Culex quinquefasciatus]
MAIEDILSSTEFAANTTVGEECPSQLPTVVQYLNGLDTILTVIIGITIVLSLVTFVICGKNISQVLRHTPKRFKTKTIVLLSIYPTVTALAMVSVLVPKSYFVCDTVSHIYFMICAYIFYSLVMAYVGGEDGFIKSSDTETFNVRTPPCCCCVPFLKRSPVTNILFFGLNIVFLEDLDNFNRIILYFVPFIAGSILLGVWGLNILVRMIAPLYEEFKIMGKYVVLQAVLILCKIQPVVIMVIVTYVTPRCDFPLVLQVQKNAVFQLCLCGEMVFLSLWAFQLYKTPSNTRQLLAKSEST